MKTGGNNPDKRQIWSLSYKTNFNCTPFFKSSSGWRTRELNPCGCRICFSLIALSGYLIRWQMTKTPPFTDKLSLFLWHTNCFTQCILCLLCLSHTHAHPLTLSYTSPQGHTQPQLSFRQVSVVAPFMPSILIRHKCSLQWWRADLPLEKSYIWDTQRYTKEAISFTLLSLQFCRLGWQRSMEASCN